MNAAAALYISDMAKTYAHGVAMAKEALAAGKAYEKLQQLREIQGSVKSLSTKSHEETRRLETCSN